MNIILLRQEDAIHNNRVVVTDYRAKHIVKVLKNDVGDSLRVGLINGKMGSGRIVSLRRKYPFEAAIEVALQYDPPKKNPVDLVLALPRPIMFKRILSQTAALGVENIHVINANRVEKSFWESGIIEKSEYQEHLIHGLEQGVDTMMPNVYFHRRFKPFIEDYLPTAASRYDLMMIAHPGVKTKLPDLITATAVKILLAVGPEGGWVDFEEGKFQQASFSGFTIGQRILKVDTAVVNIHGRIMSLLEERSV